MWVSEAVGRKQDTHTDQWGFGELDAPFLALIWCERFGSRLLSSGPAVWHEQLLAWDLSWFLSWPDVSCSGDGGFIKMLLGGGWSALIDIPPSPMEYYFSVLLRWKRRIWQLCRRLLLWLVYTSIKNDKSEGFIWDFFVYFFNSLSSSGFLCTQVEE